ncbi:hypothetical protein ABV409_10840 [Flagellimonas sp. DF-77]|uniref:hypothetical protein n=1 Tax=Flagellimonas algarum TaxID=3230298 RepID=UPI003391217C
MTVTDLFRLLIKSLGLYSLIEVVSHFLLPQMTVNWGFDALGLAFFLIYFLLWMALSFLLLFKTDKLIRWLRLDRGFDSKSVDMAGLDAETLFRFGLFVVGLLLIADNIAPFVNFCYLAFKAEVSGNGLDQAAAVVLEQYVDWGWWMRSGLGLLFGTLVVFNTKWLARKLAH